MTDFNSLPNSPLEFGISFDTGSINDQQPIDDIQNLPQENVYQNDDLNLPNFAGFNLFEERSNDFDSSVSGALVVQQMTAQKPENMYNAPQFQRPAPQRPPLQGTIVALSPNQTVSPPNIMGNMQSSKDIFLEPQVFAIKSGKKRKTQVPILTSREDEEFYSVYNNPNIKINPKRLNFIPTTFWPNDQEYSFGDIVESYFRIKNNPDARFPHKLYNALKLTSTDANFIPYIGLTWLTNDVIKVDTVAFARLLNIKSINGALFHAQGNFPSHGFVEIKSVDDAANKGIDLSLLQSIDFEKVRLLYHAENLFTVDSTEEDIARIKWTPKKDRV